MLITQGRSSELLSCYTLHGNESGEVYSVGKEYWRGTGGVVVMSHSQCDTERNKSFIVESQHCSWQRKLFQYTPYVRWFSLRYGIWMLGDKTKLGTIAVPVSKVRSILLVAPVGPLLPPFVRCVSTVCWRALVEWKSMAGTSAGMLAIATVQ